MSKIHILFVCRGNIYRSAIAEQFLKQLAKTAGVKTQLEALSRGLQGFGGSSAPKSVNLRDYPAEWNAAKDTLAELGVSLESHTATTFVPEDIRRSDFVIAMNQDIYTDLLRIFPKESIKIRQFGEFDGSGIGIPDPMGNADRKEHRRVILQIHSGVQAILEKLRLRGE